MLVRIVPEDVSQNWEYFAPMIAASFPQDLGVSRTLLTNVLAAILRGDLIVWLDYPEEGKSPSAMITTYVREDPIMCINTLLIYNLYLMKEQPLSYWKENLQTLVKYSKARKCKAIAGYTDDPKYLRWLGMVGADTKTRVAVFNHG
jgi:hypothetical protein